jgi:hypothetical protein
MSREVVRFCAEKHNGGCEGRVQEWAIEGYDPVPVFVLCEQHAAEFGFCTSCGAFIGGTEDVFLTGQQGLCFDCFRFLDEELRHAVDTYDDQDSWEWD